MSIELTPYEYLNLLSLSNRAKAKNNNPNRVSPEKRQKIIELLQNEVSVSQITKAVKASHQTVNDIRREIGAWGV